MEKEILDGATVTTAELNILDGVTSTAAELNILDGVTSTAAELNILDGVTSTASELNLLDGSTAGTVVVYAQAVDTTGGTAVLTFDAAGSDVWATGSVIESRGSSEVTFDTSAAGETKLTFTPANATTNLLTVGGQIAFICYETGTWHIATSLARETTQVTGVFAFAA